MAFCSNCGKELNANAAVCLNCGVAVKGRSIPGESDTGGLGWGLLGFAVPVAGLILWILWKDSAPRNAKSAGIGALVNAIAGVVFAVLWLILCFWLAFSSTMY